MTHEPKITRKKVAEDELSVMWETSEILETDEQFYKAAASSACGDFWTLIESYADECDKVLAAHGFPRPCQMVHDDGNGKWRPIKSELLAEREKGESINLASGYKLAKDHSVGFSDVWYAAHVGLECRLALEHWRKSDGCMDFLFAKIFHISAMRKDWHWRQQHKKNVIRGKAIRSAARAGGFSRGNSQALRNSQILTAMDAIRESSPSLSIARVAELAAKNGHGTSAGANRKLWQRHRLAVR